MENNSGGISLLIVEDEKIIRNGLVRHLPWKELGIAEIRAVQNAAEAFAVFSEFRPEIVLSDIQMPGINGVDMCRRLSEGYPGIQIIFLTGYVEKEYLKAAIALNAVSYIEKPIVLPEVKKAVRQAVENLTRERMSRQAVLHQILLKREKAENYPMELSWGQIFLLHLQKEEDVPAAMKLAGSLRISETPDREVRMMDQTDARTVVFLAGVTEGTGTVAAEDIAKKFLCQEKHWQGGWFVASGNPICGLGEAPGAFCEAESAMKCLSYLGWNQWADPSGEQTEYRVDAWGKNLLEKFRQSILNRNVGEAQKQQEEFYAELIRRRVIVGSSVRYMAEEFRRVLEKNTAAGKNFGGGYKREFRYRTCGNPGRTV